MNNANYDKYEESKNTVELDKENTNSFNKPSEKESGLEEISIEKGQINKLEIPNVDNNNPAANQPENSTEVSPSNYETLDESVWETLVYNNNLEKRLE